MYMAFQISWWPKKTKKKRGEKINEIRQTKRGDFRNRCIKWKKSPRRKMDEGF